MDLGFSGTYPEVLQGCALQDTPLALSRQGLTSRWREMSKSEFRMPPTCPEHREGSSQIIGLATRSLRALPLRDTSLALSRQGLTMVK